MTTNTAEKPTLRQQLTAALPEHAAWNIGLIDFTVSWTTPAGIWSIRRHALTVNLDTTGPGFQLTASNVERILSVLRALGAISDECTTCHGAQIITDPADDTRTQLCPNTSCRTGVFTAEYQELWADMETALQYLHTHCRGSQTAEDLLGKFGWLSADEARAAGHIPHEGTEVPAGEHLDPSRPIRRTTDAQQVLDRALADTAEATR